MFFPVFLLFFAGNCQISVGRQLQINVFFLHTRHFGAYRYFFFVFADFCFRFVLGNKILFFRQIEPVAEKAVEQIVKIFVKAAAQRGMMTVFLAADQ